MTQPHEPEPPEGYIATRVVAMTDAAGNLTDDPDKAAEIEVEQVTDDGVVERLHFVNDSTA